VAHLFISYAHVDRDFAGRLKGEIEKAGFGVWIDTERLRAGDDWRQGIDEAIKGAFALIAVMSPEAFSSQYVTYEWAFALGMSIKVIPILYRHSTMHPRLDVMQYIDCTDRENIPWDKILWELKETEKVHSYSSIHAPQSAPLVVKRAAEALESYRDNDRNDAIKTLARTTHPSAIDVLAQAVHHPIPDVRSEASLALADLTRYTDMRALPGLFKLLEHPSSEIRNTGIRVISYYQDKSLLMALELFRETKLSYVRSSIAKILGSIGDERAITELISGLDDDDNFIRSDVVHALGQIKSIKSLPALIHTLQVANADLKCDILRTFGQIKSADSVPILVEAFNDTDSRINVTAAEVLAQMGSIAVPGLLSVMKEENIHLRSAAAEILRKIGTVAVPELLAALEDEHVDVRCASLRTFGQIWVMEQRNQQLDEKQWDTRIIPNLIKLLSDIEQSSGIETRVCDYAVETLERIGTPKALEAVEQWKQKHGNGQT
jgi:HEAT repeat protein